MSVSAEPDMCNLYSLTTSQDAMRRLFDIDDDRLGNLPANCSIFPYGTAPIVRIGMQGRRELALARWGMPGPTTTGGAPVTNIRNTASPHWAPWLSPAHRCLVPVTSFCEWAPTKPKKTPTWFALDPTRPLVAFAGIWTRWHGTRGPKKEPVQGQHELFGFLTTTANSVVAPVHPAAMPVLLTTAAEWTCWLSAPWQEAAALQRPLADAMLRIVATGSIDDGPAAVVSIPNATADDQLSLFH